MGSAVQSSLQNPNGPPSTAIQSMNMALTGSVPNMMSSPSLLGMPPSLAAPGLVQQSPPMLSNGGLIVLDPPPAVPALGGSSNMSTQRYEPYPVRQAQPPQIVLPSLSSGAP